MQDRGKDKYKPQGSIRPPPLLMQEVIWFDNFDSGFTSWMGGMGPTELKVQWPLGQLPTNDTAAQLGQTQVTKASEEEDNKSKRDGAQGCFFSFSSKKWMPLSFVVRSGQSFHLRWWYWWWCWCWRSSGWQCWEGTKWRGWLGPGRSPTGRNITSATSVISSAPPPWSSSAMSSSPKCSCVGNINFLECFNFLPC